MAPGAGLVREGENGRGLLSRWYPETLAKRIRAIASVRNRISFIEGDGLDLIEAYADGENAAFFVDPPYTVAARRLYSHWQVDHRRLFESMSRTRGEILMTYDNSPEILELAKEFNFATERVAMKNTHHAKMTELLIGRDLLWLRNGRASSARRPRNVEEKQALRQLSLPLHRQES